MSKTARMREIGGETAIVPLGRKHFKSDKSNAKRPVSLGSTSAAPAPAPAPASKPLLNSEATIGDDELHTEDETALNNFLNLHPMLSLGATSQHTLKVVSSAFENYSATAPELPVVSKLYDDAMLRPPNKRIGERACACGDRCIAKFLAELRHGKDSELAFVCTEFLLPSEQEAFVNNGTLPPRPKKCLLCTRYFTNYLYFQARSDPTFRMSLCNVDVQSFANKIESPASAEGAEGAEATEATDPIDYAELTRVQRQGPASVSKVLTKDGYKPCASLFVDEEFVAKQAGRDNSLVTFMFRPIVRFSSNHYKFEMTEDGPRCLQVGIGFTDPHEIGLNFRAAPAAKQAAPPELQTLPLRPPPATH